MLNGYKINEKMIKKTWKTVSGERNLSLSKVLCRSLHTKILCNREKKLLFTNQFCQILNIWQKQHAVC
jgi:hypothetical protein